MSRRHAPHTPRLFIRSDLTPERILLNRLLLLIAVVGLVVLLFWLDREGLHDAVDGHVSFKDVVYFTAVTITTVGYGDIVPVSDSARQLDALLVTPLRLLVWLVFLGTAYELVLQRWMEARRMSQIQKTLNNHLIVCGYGHSGQAAAGESVARGLDPGQIVIMDRNAEALARAAQEGYIGLLGDATHEVDLQDAQLEKARAVLICLGRDDTTVLSVLTVRQMSSSVRVVCNVAEQENVKLVRQAGADAIVAPSRVGGYLMADSAETSHIAEYISDLMQSAGRVHLRQRPALAAEIGKTMRELEPGLAVRLIRGEESIGFWEGERARVRSGDLLLVIEPGASELS